MDVKHSEALYVTDVIRPDFQAWPKTPRLMKDMTVTEKIDGTNACVVIVPEVEGPFPDKLGTALDINGVSCDVYAQSRKRMISPERDNAGFAGWAANNVGNLVRALGLGRHYGEWWGSGIQRTYGATRKTFSLFNTDKWGNLDHGHELWGLSVVPELYRGPFDTNQVLHQAEMVWQESYVAAPGWAGSGEGVCVFHHASRTVFKVTDEGDKPKGGPRDDHGNVVPLFGRASDLAKAGFYTSEPDSLFAFGPAA